MSRTTAMARLARRVAPLLLAPLVIAGGARADGCPASRPLSAPPVFPAVSAALAGGGPLVVVALGSSSTAGTGATGPAATYPARLEALLRQRLPGRAVAVANAGVGGDTAARMLARLDADVLRRRPALVVWQVGTNDAFQQVPLDTLGAQVREGVGRLRAAGADVLLMEPQELPGQPPGSPYRRYVAAVRSLGAELGVPVLLRSAVMAEWAERGVVPAAAMLSPDGLHMTDASYACLAWVVAGAVAPPAR